jgi:hypothetical protein
MKKMMRESLGKKYVSIKKEAPPEKVILKINRVSRNGVMAINFNQRLKVPAFIDRTNLKSITEKKTKLNKSKRKMIPLSALDVGRDVFDIVFVLKSDVEPTEIGYFLEI